MSFRVLFLAFFAAVVVSGSGCGGKPPTAAAPASGSNMPGGAPSGASSSPGGGVNPGAAQRTLPANSAGQIPGVEVAIGSLSSWGGFDDGKNVGGPVIHLTIRGPKLAQTKAIRTVVKEVTSDSGTRLPPYREFDSNDGDATFREPRPPLGQLGEDKTETCEQKLYYYAPRGMSSLKRVTGTIDLAIPSLDPTNIITARISTDKGQAFTNETLKAAEVELTLPSTSPENSVSYTIKDPKNAVAALELVDARGEKLTGVVGFSTSGTKTTSMTVSIQFAAKVPADAVAKIYMHSEKSIVSVPFEFRDVPVTAAEDWGVKPTMPENAAAGRVTGAEVAIERLSSFGGTDNGRPVSGPVIYLSVMGPELLRAKGIRTVVKSATDDSGNEMKRKSSLFEQDAGKFLALKKRLGGRPRLDEFEQELSYTAASETKSMKALTGTVDLLIPTRDPASFIAASYATDAGKPLDGSGLKAEGVEITLLKPSKKDTISYEISDPKGAVGAVEWFDADGNTLELFGPFSYGNDPTTVSFSSPVGKIPADAVVTFYLVTDNSVVSVPFEFKDISLPPLK